MALLDRATRLRAMFARLKRGSLYAQGPRTGAGPQSRAAKAYYAQQAAEKKHAPAQPGEADYLRSQYNYWTARLNSPSPSKKGRAQAQAATHDATARARQEHLTPRQRQMLAIRSRQQAQTQPATRQTPTRVPSTRRRRG